AVHMFFIKGSPYIQCIMKLITTNSSITVFVQVFYKTIHQVKKAIFMYIVMHPVEPMNIVSSYHFIAIYYCRVTGSGMLHYIPRKKGDEVFFQMSSQRLIQKMLSHPYLI